MNIFLTRQFFRVVRSTRRVRTPGLRARFSHNRARPPPDTIQSLKDITISFELENVFWLHRLIHRRSIAWTITRNATDWTLPVSRTERLLILNVKINKDLWGNFKKSTDIFHFPFVFSVEPITWFNSWNEQLFCSFYELGQSHLLLLRNERKTAHLKNRAISCMVCNPFFFFFGLFQTLCRSIATFTTHFYVSHVLSQLFFTSYS